MPHSISPQPSANNVKLGVFAALGRASEHRTLQRSAGGHGADRTEVHTIRPHTS